ncbi:hypothetical protein [Adhaeribacter pallidiroseus]|uniref:hypothetical protein n=1 Tax=Adhaeribacter pallidiroseus TaxID=2072847 RepID=UPI0011C07535|nr:hypothetical protein [Adhaeribacter pallidiroseus]
MDVGKQPHYCGFIATNPQLNNHTKSPYYAFSLVSGSKINSVGHKTATKKMAFATNKMEWNAEF